MATGSIEEKLRALFAGATDPASTAEEARTKAVLLRKLAEKHGIELFSVQSAADRDSGRPIYEGMIEASRVEEAIARMRAQHRIEVERAFEAGVRTGRAEAPRMLGAARGVTWEDLARYLDRQAPGTVLEVPKIEMPALPLIGRRGHRYLLSLAGAGALQLTDAGRVWHVERG